MSNRYLLSQPVGYMKTVCDIKIASKVLAQTIATKFLDTEDRYELQDPERVRLFYKTFHSKWPKISERYPNSWVLVRYLKMYLLRRVYKKRSIDRKVRRMREIRALQEPRYRRTIQDTASSSTASSSTTSSSNTSRSRSRKSETLASSNISYASSSTNNSDMLTSPSLVQSSPTVFQFLQSTKPSLVKLIPQFMAAGIYDETLEDFFTWPAKAQYDFLLKTFNGRMNALELGALVIALETNRRVP